jgi:hypothetical protein
MWLLFTLGILIAKSGENYYNRRRSYCRKFVGKMASNHCGDWGGIAGNLL